MDTVDSPAGSVWIFFGGGEVDRGILSEKNTPILDLFKTRHKTFSI